MGLSLRNQLDSSQPRPRNASVRAAHRSSRARGALIAISGLCLAGSFACAGRKAAERFPRAPVVLISIDTLRADHLPAYGYRGLETPNVERLRKDAILFENAYSHVPLTLPAHVSILTGLLPFEHGVRDNLGYRLSPAVPTLEKLFQKQGYSTGGFVSAWVVRGASGLGDGFDVYDDHIVAPSGADAAGRAQRPGSETLTRAVAWLEEVKSKPFFLFFHIYEPHAPYEPPEPFKSRYPLAYDGEIAASDAVVGGLLDDLKRLGIYDRAVIVLLSDHGEGLGEHGEDEHGILLYRWALHVPLMLKLPHSLRAGTSLSTPHGLTDLAPTLAALTGLDLPPSFKGRSLFASSPVSERIYAETYYPRIHLGWSDLRSLIDARYQFVQGSRQELYDIAADAAERNDLSGSEIEATRVRAQELSRLPAVLNQPGEVSEQDADRLKALGYLEGRVEPRAGALPDPRQSIHALNDAKAGFRLAAAGKDAEAVTALRQVLARYPDFFDVRYELAGVLARLGRYPEAYDAYKAALRTSPSLAGPTAVQLGRVCLKLKRWDEAESNARMALAGNSAQAHELLARIALARDDVEAAEREARAVVGDPGAEPAAAVVLAEVAIRRERFQEALTLIEKTRSTLAAQNLPPVVDLDFLKGDALARLGRYPEAQAAFEQEIRSFPQNAQAYTRLAIVYGLEHRTVKEVDRLLAAMVAASPGPETRELAARTLESMGDTRGARAWRRGRTPSTPAP